jgi:UDP-N-acetylglucosamine diphosphorylase/glucosamine-1-phosphate N-acetyltransferase
MNYILFDGPNREALKPFTFTRPVADIFIGMSTLRSKFEHFLGTTCSVITEDYLAGRHPMVELESNVFIDASFVASDSLAIAIKKLGLKDKLIYKDRLVAFTAQEDEEPDLDSFRTIIFEEELIEITGPHNIFEFNQIVFDKDFKTLTEGCVSEEISKTNTVIGSNEIFIEEGAQVEFAHINTTKGPVYISKNALVMEGTWIRGPLFLGENSVLKMGAKIYGPVSIGNNCTIGGEVKNSVVFGNSSKGHEGYLGDSVIGEWCNLGADTNNSNLKNNYSEVKLWNYETERFSPTGLQFCGLIMGDHSKCGINTMFNTGTVVGVAANIFGAGYQRNFIPSFGWGGSGKFVTYKLNKVLETAKLVMERKGLVLDKEDESILDAVFEETAKFRNWE